MVCLRRAKAACTSCGHAQPVEKGVSRERTSGPAATAKRHLAAEIARAARSAGRGFGRFRGAAPVGSQRAQPSMVDAGRGRAVRRARTAIEGSAMTAPSPATSESRSAPPSRGMAWLRRLPQTLLLAVVRFYRLFFKAWLGNACRFEPSCSQYALDALQQHGALTGGRLAAVRLLRCHPGCAGGCDPVPSHPPRLFTSLLRR
jgi:uncharacterized protein